MKRPNLKKITCPLCSSSGQIKLMDKNKYNLYFCSFCKNGFVNPQSESIDEFYPEIYWQHLGPFKSIRRYIHISFQKKRTEYFQGFLTSGQVLDVGAGEGDFGKMLDKKFKVTNLEYSSSKVKGKDILKVDFLSFTPHKRFDAIVFLESLEHVTNPLKYLKKASSLLKENGLIFVEYPRFGSLESKILGKYWLQRDIPRHLFHFTEKGLRNIAEKADLKVISQRGIMSYQYSPYCLLAGIIQAIKLPTLNLRLGITKNLLTLIFLCVGAPAAFILETIFYFIGESPIGLIVLKKNK